MGDERLAALCQKYAGLRLEVFGSSAREEHRPDSDIHLLVPFMPGTPVGFLRLAGLQLQLQAMRGRKVDLVPRRGLKPLVRDRVLGEARGLFPG